MYARRVFGLTEASTSRRAAARGRGGTGRGRRIHLHHRRRSIHASPASETRTSKRLMPGWSWRAGVIHTMRASTKRRPRAPRPRSSRTWPAGAAHRLDAVAVEQVLRWRAEVSRFAPDRLAEFDKLVADALNNPVPVQHSDR